MSAAAGGGNTNSILSTHPSDVERMAALEKINFKTQDIVVLNLSGRGDKDLETYMKVSEKYS